jgi:hypothetical protein
LPAAFGRSATTPRGAGSPLRSSAADQRATSRDESTVTVSIRDRVLNFDQWLSGRELAAPQVAILQEPTYWRYGQLERSSMVVHTQRRGYQDGVVYLNLSPTPGRTTRRRDGEGLA